MKEAQKKRLVVIDGNAIIHRAYHAIPPLAAKGTMVNAVYGFTSMLLKVIADLSPTYLAVSFDVSGGTFRDEVYKEYKATRVKADQELYDQIPLVYDMVRAFRIPIYTKEGFEADDVIGTIAELAKGLPASDVEEIIIVTGDMDMLQLVEKKVRVYELRKGLTDIVLFDAEKVKEKYAFGPDMIVEYKALRGDTSDNIPGVKGIGEKTATELITKVGGIDDIYKQLKKKDAAIYQEFKTGVIKKLTDDEAGARMSRELATIKRDVPGLDFSIEACRPAWQEEEVKTAMQKFEFFSLTKRMSAVLGGKALPDHRGATKVKKPKEAVAVFSTDVHELLTSLEAVSEFAAREIVEGSDILTGKLVGLVFHVAPKDFFIDVTALTVKDKKSLAKVFHDPKRILIGHDLKRLIKVLALQDMSVENSLFDTMIASYVLNSSTRAHDLPSIILRELGLETAAGDSQSSLFGVDASGAVGEFRHIQDIYTKFTAALKEMEDVGLFQKVEMALIPVLAAMELAGVAVDVPRLKELSEEIARDIDNVTKRIWKEAGEEFNVASSTQLRDVLFEKMKLSSDGIKKGKTGYSTAASELEKLRGMSPVIEMIEEHRELAKIQNTYVDVLPGLVNPKTGRIHTTFNQAVAATGRLSSTDPNLQNIPIRTELGRKIRNAFIAPPGYRLISADYSQIELRIVASLANDEKMIEIFRANKDIHQATAAAINGVALDKVTREMRYAAKEVNFGVLYGMGAFGLAWRAGIPQWQAQEFIKKYFEQFAGVKKYMDETLVFAKETGYVETLFGRRRYIPELKAQNFQLRNAGERMAINMPIQGTAADLMKMAMIEVQNEIRNSSPPPRDPATAGKFEIGDVKLLLQVHDELVLEVKEGLEDQVSALVKTAMERVAELRVPIEVHASIGTRWGDMK